MNFKAPNSPWRPIAAAVFVLLLTANARAELLPDTYAGVRQLGMGDAFLGLGNDDNVAWYNPAALADVRGNHFTFLDLTLGVDSTQTLKNFDSAAFGKNYNALVSPDANYLRSNYKMTFIRQNFSFSIFENFHDYTQLQNLNNLDASADIDLGNDVGAMVGFGFPMGENFSIGASLKAFERSEIYFDQTAQGLINQLGGTASSILSNPINYLKSFVGTGWAVGGNVGLLAKVPIHSPGMKWTVAVTYDDVGETSFHPLAGIGPPAPIRPSINFGTAVQYLYGTRAELNFDLDYVNTTDYSDSDPFFKKIRAGAEYRYSFLIARAGVYEGQPTYGLGVVIHPHTQINFASYCEEAGDSIGADPQRRYVIQFVLGFNVL